MLGQLRAGFEGILNGHDSIEDFQEVIQEDLKQKEHFRQGIAEAKTDTQAQIEELKQNNALPTFEQYHDAQSEKVARALARRVGVEEDCARRGFSNLLKIQSVRLTVGLTLSLIYRSAVENKSVNRGSSRDLQHGPPAAAAADVLITHDRELATMVARVPMRRFKVKTLRELLCKLTSPLSE
jgi:hypothetical protein